MLLIQFGSPDLLPQLFLFSKDGIVFFRIKKCQHCLPAVDFHHICLINPQIPDMLAPGAGNSGFYPIRRLLCNERLIQCDRDAGGILSDCVRLYPGRQLLQFLQLFFPVITAGQPFL